MLQLNIALFPNKVKEYVCEKLKSEVFSTPSSMHTLDLTVFHPSMLCAGDLFEL